jgi:hypothetical protein
VSREEAAKIVKLSETRAENWGERNEKEDMMKEKNRLIRREVKDLSPHVINLHAMKTYGWKEI